MHSPSKQNLVSAPDYICPNRVIDESQQKWSALPDTPDINEVSNSTMNSSCPKLENEYMLLQECSSSISYMNLEEDAFTPGPGSVRFHIPLDQEKGCQEPRCISSPAWNEEDVRLMWWTQSELRSFYMQARVHVKHYRDSNPRISESLQDLYQAAANTDTKFSILMQRPAAKTILKISIQHDYSEADGDQDTIRGLESFLHPGSGQAKAFHVQRLLALQVAYPPTSDVETMALLLRTRSFQSSRASRVLARLLAHGDYLRVAQMLRQELKGLDDEADQGMT